MGAEQLTPHDEVLSVLRQAAPEDPEVGERIRLDRGSDFKHLGLRTPARRKLVKAGFSFYHGEAQQILTNWDNVWRQATCADVLFAVLDYYREQLKKNVDPAFWPVARTWLAKVDNWAHADDLARVYSWALAAHPAEVLPDLERWNGEEGEWHRRVSIVSLVHYSGKNAVFMKPAQVLPLVRNCLIDERTGMQKAAGWVLREMAAHYPEETIDFIESNRTELSATTLRRATERMDPALKSRLRS